MINRATWFESLRQEFSIFVKKRLTYKPGWYDCCELENFIFDIFKLGVEYIMTWNDFYINPPKDGTRILLRYDDNTYIVCDYKDHKIIDINHGLEIHIVNTCKWRYLNYPADRI